MTYSSRLTPKSSEFKNKRRIRKRKKKTEIKSLVYLVKQRNGSKLIGGGCWIEEHFKKCVRRKRSVVERGSD